MSTPRLPPAHPETGSPPVAPSGTQSEEKTPALKGRVFDSFREAFLAQQTDGRPIWEVGLEPQSIYVLAKTETQVKDAILEHLVIDIAKLDRDQMMMLARDAMKTTENVE